MGTMNAALVSAFGEPPRFRRVDVPRTRNADEVIVTVLAAGLHPRVRSQANGSHYTSTGDLPFVPGIDGVGRGPDGELRYFILPDTTMGSMAEKTVVDTRRSVTLPESVDPVAVAAAMNPAMSSWVALRKRIRFEAGQSVLILGATGNAGRLAVQIAKLFGASEIVAAGRNADALAALRPLGATGTVLLDEEPDLPERLGEAAKDVDVVIDYLWGRPTADALAAVVPRRSDDARRLTWIQIGSVAGPTSPIPSAALRAARLELVGSGQGSVATRDILDELPGLAARATDGTLRIGARPVPLADVERVWTETPAGDERVVLVPA